MPEEKKIEEKMGEFLEGFEDRLKKEKEGNAELTDQKIEAAKKEVKEELQSYVDRVRQNNVNLPGMEEQSEKKKFSWTKACRAIINNDWDGAGYEKEVLDETKKKAVDTNTGGQGGFLIPTELSGDILKPALAQTVMKEAGMTVYEGLTADFDIAGVTSRPSLVWTSDGQAQSEQNIDHRKESMRPKEGGMLVKVSNRLLMQASVAEKVVKDLMIEGATIGLDNIAIQGKGTDKEPMGIINAGLTTTASVGGGGGRLVVDKVASMIADVEDNDFGKIQNTMALVTKPRVKSGLKRERVAQFAADTSGQPLIMPLMSDAVLEDTLGIKVRCSTQVPVVTGGTLTYAIVGEFSKFALGVWGGLRLKTSDTAGTAFASNQTWIVAFVDVDTALLHNDAFCLLSDAESNEANW
jgi:HK97 family phage major capsid protein